MNNIISISFDDIDSQYGGCTTHFTGIFFNEIKNKVKLIDYPLLIRLNPGIPWKTRGNASTALRFIYDDPKEIFEIAKNLVDEYTNPRPPLPNKKPGIVMIQGKPWENEKFKTFYKKTLSDFVLLDDAIKLLNDESNKENVFYYGGKGLIGATAAQGALGLYEPYTYELIFYRLPENWDKERCVDDNTVLKVDKSLPSCTINNYDYIKEKSSVKPNGPDPILAGFRGTCEKLLWNYEKSLCEKPHFSLLYRSNQHTSFELFKDFYPYPYRNVEIEGTVLNTKILPKGHVIITLRTKYGDFDISFYKDTGPLNKAAKLLEKGDVIKVQGSVRPYSFNNTTISAYSMEVISINYTSIKLSPRCVVCGSRMKSLGKGKGFRCEKCGFETKNVEKIEIIKDRKLLPGIYLPETGELMHLQKEKYVRLPILTNFPNVDEHDILKIYNNP
ncbi:putative DNA-binding protein containing a Zn-ribbon domain [Caldisphaera lagunensis DSM 15908]|uniref:tRNA(Ile2) 2-agmatinylcytidine synthetase TiaS n=1 Tax=Caldisphaera lagunensis (strain DSM 15908 / JCM 11604 / ANMR 0165 / IC-154) TaxID=1056495 RepID=L0ABA2_CALLD|nr:tRNA(Ile)(2)-agmatinylcytidine synthase [Caldisphaera lagunensis]AFZ70330.1 putative DNA-binding protein containing a Zn-ribbon domain [Caldisphaera lagunensis DSM 15908]